LLTSVGAPFHSTARVGGTSRRTSRKVEAMRAVCSLSLTPSSKVETESSAIVAWPMRSRYSAREMAAAFMLKHEIRMSSAAQTVVRARTGRMRRAMPFLLARTSGSALRRFCGAT
jgi:hypothetical protein